MTAAPTPPDATTQPDPSQDPARDGVTPGADATPEVTRLLALIRWLITYGRQLATTLHQHADPARFADLAFRFQTTDLTHILARITRGLMLAGMLEARLTRWQTIGHEARTPPLPLPSERAPRNPLAVTKPRPRHINIIDLPLDCMPSAEAIAAELRRRPLGAVLADICRDLCLQPGDLEAERWEDLVAAVIRHGGQVVPLMFGIPMFEKAREVGRRALAGKPYDDLDWVIPVLDDDVAAVVPAEPPGGREPRVA